MVVCASCGAENREGARFCDSCGASLAEAPPMREVRKTVTVLFCDVSGSTAIGEQIDPESLRHVMARYFEAAKMVVERHGGTVEKFIGDAVMAVFGVPAVHEDDALRAVRAAEELRTGLAGLNEELEQAYGTRLELRMGVNTGQVVTGTKERLATGDAVNIAARLEQAAKPGEVLLGDETFRLVRDAVEAEPVPAVEAKGKAQPLAAVRLLAVRADAAAVARRHAAPMVGRERQRKLLEDAYATVAGERACHLFTILGTAGVGKSRLVSEVLRSLDGATVVRGRCLSYGEGITYLPVTEVVKQLLAGSENGAGAALSAILGDESAASSPEEIAWAFRKLLEARAAGQPLVVVFEDIHWGEPVFLDLVEHVADLSRGAPILLLCMARPELLDTRPAWGGGKLNATNVLLEPLPPDEAAKLIAELLPGRLADDLQERILAAAGGNPLFVEEMVAMVAEQGSADVSVPPTIQALLAARLDQLDPAERGVLERGAVEGQVFHRGAVVALAPEEAQVDGRLITLVRKDLVRPEPAVLAGDEAFRFRHLLIRDTAYEALPKATRAELHERFAAWLQEHSADLVELDEILGYHLEQAYRYRAELGPLDERAVGIAARAGTRLADAAERARERGDLAAAQAFLSRASDLLRADDPARRAAQLDLAVVLIGRGSFPEAGALLEELAVAAEAAGDERIQARVELARIEMGIETDPLMTIAGALETLEAAAAALERLGDIEGVVWAERLIGMFSWWSGRTGDAERVWSRALERAALPRLVADLHMWIAWSLWTGPVPTDEGIRRCDEMLARFSGNPQLEGPVLVIRASLKAMRGLAEAARAEAAAGRALLRDVGHYQHWAGTAMVAGDIELTAGDAAAAAAVLVEGYDHLRPRVDTGYLTSLVGMRAQAALELGQDEEALRFADETEALASPDDLEPRVRQACVRAVVLARRGDLAAAAEVLDQAERIAAPMDFLTLKALLALKRAEVASLAGDATEERKALAQALALSDQKGDLVTAERARARLAERE